MARGAFLLAVVPLLAACSSMPSSGPTGPQSVAVYAPPPGINQMLEGRIAAAPGHSLIVGDLNMGPGAAIPRHYHHGEEYIECRTQCRIFGPASAGAGCGCAGAGDA